MKIGDRIEITENWNVLSYKFEKGHQFTIICKDDMRGYDVVDDEGREVHETRFSGIEYKKV